MSPTEYIEVPPLLSDRLDLYYAQACTVFDAVAPLLLVEPPDPEVDYDAFGVREERYRGDALTLAHVLTRTLPLIDARLEVDLGGEHFRERVVDALRVIPDCDLVDAITLLKADQRPIKRDDHAHRLRDIPRMIRRELISEWDTRITHAAKNATKPRRTRDRRRDDPTPAALRRDRLKLMDATGRLGL